MADEMGVKRASDAKDNTPWRAGRSKRRRAALQICQHERHLNEEGKDCRETSHATHRRADPENRDPRTSLRQPIGKLQKAL